MLTTTSTVPATCTGETAVIDVGPFTMNDAADVPLNNTDEAPERFVPVIVTLVPPAVGPEFGATFVTVGGGGRIVSANACSAAGLISLSAVNVGENVPGTAAGLTESVAVPFWLSVNVTPADSAELDKLGIGTPVAVTVKVPPTPAWNTALFPDVICGAASGPIAIGPCAGTMSDDVDTVRF